MAQWAYEPDTGPPVWRTWTGLRFLVLLRVFPALQVHSKLLLSRPLGCRPLAPPGADFQVAAAQRSSQWRALSRPAQPDALLRFAVTATRKGCKNLFCSKGRTDSTPMFPRVPGPLTRKRLGNSRSPWGRLPVGFYWIDFNELLQIEQRHLALRE